MKPDLQSILGDHDLRVTKPRQAVFKALLTADMPLSIIEIVKKCSSVDRVTIYRTIDLFTKLHIVEIIPRGWKQRYELATPFRPHHHHLYCTSCHKIEETDSEQLESIIHDLAAAQGFTVSSHTFEINGLCKECQQEN
jgi:Fe2+ or Zn2+ uptake regulation protein